MITKKNVSDCRKKVRLVLETLRHAENSAGMAESGFSKERLSEQVARAQEMLVQALALLGRDITAEIQEWKECVQSEQQVHLETIRYAKSRGLEIP